MKIWNYKKNKTSVFLGSKMKNEKHKFNVGCGKQLLQKTSHQFVWWKEKKSSSNGLCRTFLWFANAKVKGNITIYAKIILFYRVQTTTDIKFTEVERTMNVRRMDKTMFSEMFCRIIWSKSCATLGFTSSFSLVINLKYVENFRCLNFVGKIWKKKFLQEFLMM